MPLGEDATLTAIVPASPAGQSRLDDNRRSLGREIPKRSLVGTVPGVRLSGTDGTGSAVLAIDRNDPAELSSLDRQDI